MDLESSHHCSPPRRQSGGKYPEPALSHGEAHLRSQSGHTITYYIAYCKAYVAGVELVLHHAPCHFVEPEAWERWFAGLLGHLHGGRAAGVERSR